MAIAQTPWVYIAMFAFATIDGFFPPIPSESALIALAALWASTGHPSLIGVMIAGALGAFLGDHIAYWIGTWAPLRKLPGMGGPRGERIFATARAELAKRGASYLIAARFIPVGRVAVNLTAGHVGLPVRRFTPIIGLAAVFWSVYSTAIGLTAGAALRDNPLLGIAVGIVAGIALGFVVDRVVQWFLGRSNGGGEATAADEPGDSDTEPQPDTSSDLSVPDTEPRPDTSSDER